MIYEACFRSSRGTHARLIWATTTPFPEGSRKRLESDAVAYNSVARKIKIMDENRIPIDGLHAFIEGKPNKESL